MDVIVIGAGLMGAASTMALARRGHRVTTLEARRLGHRQGSSHGSFRIYRHSYVEPHYVEMTRRAGESWRDVERLCGRRLLTLTGGLDHGERRRVEELLAAQTAAGVECELLGPRVAARRWPHMRFATDVLFTPDAGVIAPELAVVEMLRVAEALGARMRQITPVLDVEARDAGVRIVTGAGRLEADAAVVAAGPWLPGLLDGVVELPRLTVTQQQVFHFARRGGESADLWPVVVHDGELPVYALPGGEDGGIPGNMKVAEHDGGVETSADDRDDRVDEAGRLRVVEYVRRWWPGLLPVPVAAFTCLYTRTPDEGFVLDRVGSVVVCSPCSGHGAKFAPLIGEWMADLVEGNAPPYLGFGLKGRAGHPLS
jgi:sarcosine oxidase